MLHIYMELIEYDDCSFCSVRGSVHNHKDHVRFKTHQGEVQAPLFSLLSSFTTPIYSFYTLSNLLFDLRQ